MAARIRSALANEGTLTQSFDTMAETENANAMRCEIPKAAGEPVRFRFAGAEGSFHSRLPRVATQASPPGGGGGAPSLCRETGGHCLGGKQGRIICVVWKTEAFEWAREVWLPDDESPALAVRLRILNTGHTPLQLEALEPVSFRGADALRIGGTPTRDWELLAHGRDKNDVPATRRFGDFPSRTEVDEQGETIAVAESGPLDLRADPFLLFRGGNAGFLIGFLGWTEAASEIVLRSDAQRRALVGIETCSEMDGAELAPGKERTSEWVLLASGPPDWRLVGNYAEAAARWHGVNTPSNRPPSVWCSWYHYGNEFAEPDLHEELAALIDRGVPFDVVLIDDFRPRAWGDWLDCPSWPSGLADAARRIRKAGYRPGFWTAPYVVEPDSRLAQAHPDWILRRRDGAPVVFVGQRHSPEPEPNPRDPGGDPVFSKIFSDFHVLDPTHPGVEAHLEELYRHLTGTLGLTYHKFDFMRALTDDPEARFHDPSATRVQAYRRGLAAIRRGTGPEAYLSVCGGHYGASIGLADSQRSGTDVQASWHHPPAAPKLKQNLLRTWMNRFWHTDADALMVRRREKPVAPTFGKRLSIGRLNDDEARTMAVNQYAGGGLVCATEHFADLDDDRFALYRHVLPPLRTPGEPLDPFHPVAPTRVRNRIEPLCPDLAPWITVALFNWSDEVEEAGLRLDQAVVEALPGERFLVFDFFAGRVLGVFGAEAEIPARTVPPHGVRLLRIAPWDGRSAVLAGTNGHFSGGGVEIAAWGSEASGEAVRFRPESPWKGPIRVWIAFPASDGCAAASLGATPGHWQTVRRADAVVVRSV